MKEGDAIEIDPAEAHRLLSSDETPVLLIDCREPAEFELARIEGANLVPLATIGARADEIREAMDTNGARVVVYCHHGVRSLEAARTLRSKGVDAASMAGGIDRWSREVDPAVPRY